ncbi:PEP-CTERM sorting domain-containing protein [bacterium]|nr:PEP-CTERM sorting domain-containing protein [bacterium]
MKYTTHSKLAAAGLSLALMTSGQAAITAVGSTADYTFESSDWQTHTANDIDANGLGTDGTFFLAQNFDTTTATNNQPFANNTSNLPSYATVAAGADFISIAQNLGISLIDNPDNTSGDDVNSGAGVFRNGTGLPAGNFVDDAIQVTIGALEVGQIVRLGFLVNNEGTADGRWDATSLSISDGTDTVTFGDHAGTQLAIVQDAAWILVDVDAPGTYTLGGTKRIAGNQGISFGGVTFDSVTVPEPSTGLLAGFAGLALALRRRR